MTTFYFAETYDDAIDAVYNRTPAAFQDAVGSILHNKLRERINIEKIAVSQNFFNEPQLNQYEDEVVDEDI